MSSAGYEETADLVIGGGGERVGSGGGGLVGVEGTGGGGGGMLGGAGTGRE